MFYAGDSVQARTGTIHLVQLFDSADSGVAAVSGFLEEGFGEGDPLLVVMAQEQWTSVADRLRAIGIPIETAMESGQLTVRDAAATLNDFMRGGRPDRELFANSVGTRVRQLVSRGGRARIYGAMVDLLAAAGEFLGARQLEEFWNDLGDRESFTLLCGYSAEHFGNPRAAEALRSICRAHTQLRSNPRDLLGSFLLHTHASDPPRGTKTS